MQTADNRFELLPALADRLRDEACSLAITACCISLNDKALREYLPEILRVPLYFVQDKNNHASLLWKILPPDLKIEGFIIRPDGKILSSDFIGTKTEDIINKFYSGMKESISEKELILTAINEIAGRTVMYKKTNRELIESGKIFLFTDNIGLKNLYSQQISIPQSNIIVPVLCEAAESIENKKHSGTFLGILPPVIIDPPGKMPVIIEKIKEIHSSFTYRMNVKHEMLFKKNNGQPLILLKHVSSGTEGVIFTVREKDRLAKILFRPREKEKRIEKLCDIKMDFPGICLPETLLVNSRRETAGYLMKRAYGFLLLNLLFRPGHCGITRDKDIPRKKIIQDILKKIIFINKHGFFLSDINFTNFVVNPEAGFETYFIDMDNLSEKNEEQQNNEIPELIFEILASGLRLEQRNTRTGIYFWHRVLEQKLRDRFEQHLQGRKIKPEEWLELFT